MGFFSWKTQNTNRSISNRYSDKLTFPVIMTDDKGNGWYEGHYDGYGKFGGKDFFVLLAEMNGLSTRNEGINLAYSKQPYKSPNLYELPEDLDGFANPIKYNLWVDEAPEDCEYQGYFY